MKTRSAEIYITPALAAKLRFIGEVTGKTCGDEYAEQVLAEHLAAMYPQLDAVMRRANDARAMVLDQARQQLNPNQQEESK
jgi:hypothetical protein